MKEPMTTATPWRLGASYRTQDILAGSNALVARVMIDHAKGQADAELIVRAVNSHQALVDALTDIMEHLPVDDGISSIPIQKLRIAAARAALDLAQGGAR